MPVRAGRPGLGFLPCTSSQDRPQGARLLHSETTSPSDGLGFAPGPILLLAKGTQATQNGNQEPRLKTLRRVQLNSNGFFIFLGCLERAWSFMNLIFSV